ncbi:GNAT family N-acetyltransferase [Sphaerisporangium rhizosphaerae]|uniref:GNAT family N-acetyltransferase n=1 Tax=Sphaerisporangium rhizosphaerae TaxID=2269375 RepID=A0ABW2PEJ9_9ACTN
MPTTFTRSATPSLGRPEPRPPRAFAATHTRSVLPSWRRPRPWAAAAAWAWNFTLTPATDARPGSSARLIHLNRSARLLVPARVDNGSARPILAGIMVTVPELVDPTGRFMTSFVAALAEFRADPDHPVPWFVDDVDPRALVDSAAFEAYTARVLGERNPSGVRPGFVPMTTLWWADGEHFLGGLAIRHRLTPALEKLGGHIGYHWLHLSQWTSLGRLPVVSCLSQSIKRTSWTLRS